MPNLALATSARRYFTDPAVLLNAVLRLALLGWVGFHGHWIHGDSRYFLDNAAGICSGAWGGDDFRPPLYSWFLCAAGAAGVPAALLLQTGSAWLAGALLYRPERRWISYLWLYDPVLLAFSYFVMSDSLFATLGLGVAFLFHRALWAPAPRWAAGCGLALGAAVLLRPLGLPLAVLAGLVGVWQAWGRRWAWRNLAWLGAAFLLALAPRLLWTQQVYGRPFLATEGNRWLTNIAAMVEYADQDLSPVQAEERFYREHPAATARDAWKVFADQPATFAKLSLKGWARVLVGHANLEWIYLLSGQNLRGPGWFRESGDMQDFWKERAYARALWVVGLALTLGVCLAFYWGYARALLGSGAWRAELGCLAWVLSSAAALIVLQNVAGEARFRLPAWALLLFSATLIAPRHPPA